MNKYFNKLPIELKEKIAKYYNNPINNIKFNIYTIFDEIDEDNDDEYNRILTCKLDFKIIYIENLDIYILKYKMNKLEKFKNNNFNFIKMFNEEDFSYLKEIEKWSLYINNSNTLNSIIINKIENIIKFSINEIDVDMEISINDNKDIFYEIYDSYDGEYMFNSHGNIIMNEKYKKKIINHIKDSINILKNIKI